MHLPLLLLLYIYPFNYRSGGTPTVEIEDDNADGVTALRIMEEAWNTGGRPHGTTIKRKRTTNLAVVAATNKIASLYAHKMREAKQRVSKNILINLIKRHKKEEQHPRKHHHQAKHDKEENIARKHLL